jgi:hypothetical protein
LVVFPPFRKKKFYGGCKSGGREVKISRTILPRDFQLYVDTGPETGLNQHKVGNVVK